MKGVAMRPVGHSAGPVAIGSYGCSGRIVKVETRAKPFNRPRQAKVECPACGREHRTSDFQWRRPLAGEKAEVVL